MSQAQKQHFVLLFLSCQTAMQQLPTGLYAGSLNFCREAQNCGPEVVFAQNKNVWELKFTFVNQKQPSEKNILFQIYFPFNREEKTFCIAFYPTSWKF